MEEVEEVEVVEEVALEEFRFVAAWINKMQDKLIQKHNNENI